MNPNEFMDNVSYYLLHEQMISLVININHKFFEELINERALASDLKERVNCYEFIDILQVKEKISAKASEISFQKG